MVIHIIVTLFIINFDAVPMIVKLLKSNQCILLMLIIVMIRLLITNSRAYFTSLYVSHYYSVITSLILITIINSIVTIIDKLTTHCYLNVTIVLYLFIIL